MDVALAAATDVDRAHTFDDLIARLEFLDHQFAIGAITKSDEELRSALSDAARRVVLREFAPSWTRSTGSYFTGTVLSSAVWDRMTKPLTKTSVVFDPTCGAGDLLIPAIQRFRSIEKFFNPQMIRGCDRSLNFVRAARHRLALQMRVAELAWRGETSASAFTGIVHRDIFESLTIVESATHIVMNPPFSQVRSERDWSSGRVSQAALISADVLARCRTGTQLVCVLPDSLRSGQRYRRWRDAIEQQATVHQVDQWGKFDSSTDIDVFILSMTRSRSDKSGAGVAIDPLRSNGHPSGLTVAEKFTVSVGAVVPHRDPERGPLRAYVKAGDLPTDTVVSRIGGRRRFSGRVHQPPFVAVRRTSSPTDRHRIRAAVVTGKRPVAVENHLLILTPDSALVRDCVALMAVLHSDATAEWINARFRARHLPKRALEMLPLERGVVA